MLKKFVGGGTKSIVISLFMSMMLLVSSVLPAFAIADGDTVSYTSSSPYGAVAFNVAGFDSGMCCELGVQEARSGTATVTRLSNSTLTARVAWWIVKNNKATDDSPVPSIGPTYTEAELAENYIQISRQGEAGWTAAARSIGYDPNGILNRYHALSFDETPPSNFEVYACDAGSSQDFVIWRYSPTGKIKLKKASSNTSITG